MRVARREPSNDAIVLGVLDAVERNPSVTQRSVARELGIALGLVNAYLNRCLSKGLIKIGQVPPRRYAYYLTPRGPRLGSWQLTTPHTQSRNRSQATFTLRTPTPARVYLPRSQRERQP